MYLHACMHAQLCTTLCNPMNYSPPGSSIHGLPRQEYQSALPFLSSGDLPYPGIEPMSLASPALAGRFFTTLPLSLFFTIWESPYEYSINIYCILIFCIYYILKIWVIVL